MERKHKERRKPKRERESRKKGKKGNPQVFVWSYYYHIVVVCSRNQVQALYYS
jgi:hypothetical protein